VFGIFKKIIGKDKPKDESKEEIANSIEESKSIEDKPKSLITSSLSKTINAIKKIIPKTQEKISKELLEEVLIESDMEYDVIEIILDKLPNSIKREELESALLSLFKDTPTVDTSKELPKPFVELIIGVNGAGKTTTIAKLTNLYKSQGRSVLLGAGDTFRAAAIEQLSLWAAKLDVPIIKTKQGHDSSAVAFDTISSAKAKNIDHAIIDTAGRLQTQTNLSNELKKIVRVCSKAQESTPHQKLLILDGTQGNSAVNQAIAFRDMVGVDGVIITKLDGTAKGGAIFSIAYNLNLPIFYIGVGEKAQDLEPFDSKIFVNSILDSIYTVKESEDGKE
jgi:fused signal recognition particle receptor